MIMKELYANTLYCALGIIIILKKISLNSLCVTLYNYILFDVLIHKDDILHFIHEGLSIVDVYTYKTSNLQTIIQARNSAYIVK